MTPPNAGAAASRPSTSPASTKTAATAATTKPAVPPPAPDKPVAKKGKGALAKWNALVLRASAGAREIAAAIDRGMAGLKEDDAQRILLMRAGTAVRGIAEQAGDASLAFLSLEKAKWAPPKKRGAGDWLAGDEVALKPKRIGRYGGAFEKDDLSNLVVVSVHGKMVKAQIQRGGLKGEVVGVLPGTWLKRRAD